MPSLRRTTSTPSVRSSPYPYSSSHSPPLIRARNQRRSSGSETSTRRILADIDWWRVTDGQCDPNTDDVQGTLLDEHHRQVFEDGLVTTAAFDSIDAGVDHPSNLLSLPWVPDTMLHVSDPLNSLPIEQFAALSISPSTPPRHGHDSLSSSVESSPEFAETLLEDIPLELDMGFFDSPLPPLTRFRRGPRPTLAPSLVRSFTFAETHSLHIETSSHYADFAISPLSSAPDFLD